MPLVLEEVKDERDFDEIIPMLYAAFGEPYNSLRRWFIPVHTTVEAAIEASKERTVKSWKQHQGIHWIKVTDTDSGKIIGAGEWEIREKIDTPNEPQQPINAYWHIEGSDEKAFAGKLLTSLKGFMNERMSRPHLGTYAFPNRIWYRSLTVPCRVGATCCTPGSPQEGRGEDA